MFASDRAKAGSFSLYGVNADGTGEVTRLTDSPENHLPQSWHPSGRFLALHADRLGTSTDLLILPMGDATLGWTPDTPQVWSPASMQVVGPTNSGYDLHPDGKRVAARVAPNQASSVQDKVVFVFNFGDYLRTIAPGTK